MSKTVALSEEAYAALARLQKTGQSLSDVVLNLVARRRPSIRDVGGLLADESKHWKDFADGRRRERNQTADRVPRQDD